LRNLLLLLVALGHRTAIAAPEAPRPAAPAQNKVQVGCTPAGHTSLPIAEGVSYWDCRDTSTRVHVVAIDKLGAGRHYQMELLQERTPCPPAGCPPPSDLRLLTLRNLATLATSSSAVVAINGYTWHGDDGRSPLGDGYGIPTTTTFRNGVQQSENASGCCPRHPVAGCPDRYDTNTCYLESWWMGFPANTTGRLEATLLDDVPQPLPASNPPPEHRHALYGAHTAIVRNGQCTTSGSSGNWSVVGYKSSHIFFLTTAQEYALKDLCPVLAAFGVTDAVVQDGGSAAQMFVQAPGPGPIVPEPIGIWPRNIAYGIGLVPRPPAVDLAFVFDLTGSMWDDLDRVKAQAEQIVTAVADTAMDFRIAVTSFKDHPVPPHGSGSDYPYRAHRSFSSDRNAVVQAIRSLGVGGGGDTPEAVCSGLKGTVEANGLEGGWRANAVRAIILIGDAEGHEPEPVSGCKMDDVVALAGQPPATSSARPAAAVKPQATAAAAPQASPVAIHSILIGSSPPAAAQFEQYARRTGGTFNKAATANDVVAAILKVIRLPPPNRAPICSGAVASAPMLWPPNQKMRDVTVQGVVDPDGDPVRLTITGIKQDESPRKRGKGPAEPDGVRAGPGGGVKLRAERSGPENGRVYQIAFDADDGKGGRCSGVVLSCVPHDQSPNAACVNDGAKYDSAGP